MSSRAYTSTASMLQRLAELQRTAAASASANRSDAKEVRHMRALHTAATGMTAQELNVQVISNRHRQHAHDGLQTPARRIFRICSTRICVDPVRVTFAAGYACPCPPPGIEIGTGVKSVSTARRHVPGRDLAHGEGLRPSPFAARASSASRCRMAAPAYSRDGGFELNAEGEHRNQGWVPRRTRNSGSPQDARSVSIFRRGPGPGSGCRSQRTSGCLPE